MNPSASMSQHSRGLLSFTPLPELLALALERRLKGSFVFETPDGTRSALVLDQGHVRKARAARASDPLGRLLVEAGNIDPATLSRGLRLATERRRRLGEELLRLCALEPGVLEATLGEQLARRVALISQLPPASAFTFVSGRDLLLDRPACEVEPLALIWRCVRDAEFNHPKQEALLARLRSCSLRSRDSAGLERFGLDAAERSWVAQLGSAPQTLDQILALPGLEPQRARRLVYVLVLTQHLAPDEPARERSSAPAPASSAAPVSAPSSSRPPLAPLSGDVLRALEQARSPRSVDTGASLEAHSAVATAKRHMARREFERAERLVQLACETDPTNAEYLALHAWLRTLLGELEVPHKAAQIVAALDRAVMKQRSSSSIRFYRAQVLKRLGRDADALEDLKFVVRREPQHIDALRELRLHAMRKQQKRGVFARWFPR